MKIAYLLGSVSRKSGGIFEICRHLTRTLAKSDDMLVVGLRDEFTNEDIGQWAPLTPKVFSSRGPSGYGFAPGLGAYLTELQPDLTHVHGLWMYSSWAADRWSRRSGKPVVYTAHGMLEPWARRNSRWKKRLVRSLYEERAHQQAACWQVNSEAEYRTLREGGLTNPICIIPNGIDLPRQGDISKGETHATKGRKLLLYLGRLHPKKNLVALLKAWESIQQSAMSNQPSEEWMLTIAGWDQGGYEKELKSWTAKFGIQRSVTFLGPQFGSDKEGCYRSCDAFILPSLSEGLPMVVLEAWAYGKPVLITRECNLPEGFATGAAIETGAGVDAIVEGLIALMAMSDAARREMGDRGRALVTEKFSWEQVGAEMRRVYEWVLGSGPAPESVRLD